MKYTNILEKLMCIIDMISANWIYSLFLIAVVLFLTLVGLKLITKKTCFISILMVHLCLLGYTIFTYNKELGSIGNDLINNFFMNVYFPSAYVYLFIITFIDITTFVSLISFTCNKIYKWINGVFFFIIQFVSLLILELLSKNKIDIFSQTSLFSNKNLIMLLEFSVNTFIAWIITIIFVYVTNIITEKITLSSVEQNSSKEKLTTVDMSTLTADIDLTETETPSIQEQPESSYIDQPVLPIVSSVETPVTVPYIEPVKVPEIINSVEQTNNFIDNNTIGNNEEIIIPVSNITPVTNSTQVIDIVSKPIETKSFNMEELIPQKSEIIIPEPIMNAPSINYQENIPEENFDTNNYTLNDYRIFNKMLKEIKEHNHSNTITINKDLEYRLITKYSTETYNMFKKMLKTYAN